MRIWQQIKRDREAILSRDPAAKSKAAVVLTYRGFHALVAYRFAHALYTHGCKLAAHLLSHIAARRTGVEIHPAAVLGSGIVIDHGCGVVIGETAIVGDDVTMYHGVTLGGTGKQSGKRHPTVGNGVVIGCGAKLLGDFGVGDGAHIGAGSVVLREVPPRATVTGVPGRIVRLCGKSLSPDYFDTHAANSPRQKEETC